MTQGERIKEVRTSLGLTLEKFGDRVGVTKVAISNIEKGNRNLTEQMTKSICREFGVDYIWLTTGDGNMFDDRKAMIKALLYASDDDIAVVNNMINSFLSFRNSVKEKD